MPSLKIVTREIDIELTPEQEPVWEKAINTFSVKSTTLRDYYDLPISWPVKGKARMPYDFDLIFELITFLKQFNDADPRIRNEICHELTRVWVREKLI